MPITNRKAILFILATVNFTHIVDSMLIMPLGDIFIEEFKISASEFSYLVSAYAFAAFFSSILGTFLIDRFDRKQAFLTAYIGFAIGTLLCAFAQGYEMLLGLRFLTGLFGGVIGAIVLSIVSDLYLFKERGSAMGVLFAAFSAASALGIPIGLFLAAKSNWQLPFMIIGILGLVISTIIYFVFPKMTDHFSSISEKPSMIKTVTAITSDKNQVNALIAGGVLILAHFLIIPFISPYMIKNVGFTQVEISYQFFLGGVATIFSAPLIGRWTDRIGVMKVFSVLMVLSFIPTLLITHLSFVPIWVGLCYTTLFFILASGRMIAPNALITAAAPTANRGSFMSVKSALQQLAIGMSALISGQIIYLEDDAYFNYHLVGYLAIAIGIVSIWLVSKIKVAEGN